MLRVVAPTGSRRMGKTARRTSLSSERERRACATQFRLAAPSPRGFLAPVRAVASKLFPSPQFADSLTRRLCRNGAFLMGRSPQSAQPTAQSSRFRCDEPLRGNKVPFAADDGSSICRLGRAVKRGRPRSPAFRSTPTPKGGEPSCYRCRRKRDLKGLPCRAVTVFAETRGKLRRRPFRARVRLVPRLIPILGESTIPQSHRNFPVNSRPKKWGGYTVGIRPSALRICAWKSTRRHLPKQLSGSRGSCPFDL